MLTEAHRLPQVVSSSARISLLRLENQCRYHFQGRFIKRNCNSVSSVAYDLAAQDTTALHRKSVQDGEQEGARTTPQVVRTTAFPLAVVPGSLTVVLQSSSDSSQQQGSASAIITAISVSAICF